MPKAKTINTYLVLWFWLVAAAPSLAQPVLGQAIEQAKKNKLNELFPAAAEESPSPGGPASGLKALPQEPPTPVLWALSGINSQLNAEVLLADEIQRFPVVRGYVLRGGWVVVSGDGRGLTLQNGKKVLTLFPPAPGTTGSEFVGLRKAKANDGEALNVFSGQPKAVPAFRPPSPSQPPPANLNAARQAAGSLPKKP